MKAALLAAGLASAAVVPASAHDYWIEPSSFAPKLGELVKVRFFVGQDLTGETVPRDETHTLRFSALRSGVETPVLGIDGDDPAGLLRPADAGGVAIVFRSARSPLQLPASKFEAYLDAEGLDGPMADRARRGLTAADGREVYSRCAKALLAVGGAGGADLTKPVGLTLELVPETDPYAMIPGAALTVRLLYEGRPLSGALVMALDAGSAGHPQKIRSDASGRATFVLSRPGMWLIKAVQMIPAPRDTGADWESLWASLTFAVPPPR